MKKAISIFGAMLIAGAMTVSPCMAKDDFAPYELFQENNTAPYNLVITNNKANLNHLGNSIHGSVYAFYDVNYTAKMSVIVQRSTNEINWSKAGSLGTVSGYDGELSLDGYYPAVSGYYYRLEATVTVYDGGSVVETLTFHSNIV